jgi:hypothetical protein
MAKMGYDFKTGKGLGKHGEGRLEPVEVIVLPEGIFFQLNIIKLRNTMS